MKIVATMMVRDEADVVAAVVEHLVDQGVDLVIVTDNGSVDGTTQILQDYADAGVVELHHDPVHRKQQHSVVTGMARRAYTEHGADWVLNVDADEFFKAVDPALTLRDALEATPLELGAYTLPVVNLVGPPARRGSGIDRLLWRDVRTDEQLQQIGINAQPTDNCVHRGDADVVVAQGNHFVSIESTGQPAEAFALECLHVPWRSWAQLERKVDNAGRAYIASPDLKPSKNHHGMADYKRHLGGRLEYAFLLRSPLQSELDAGATTGDFARDTWLRDHLHGLVGKAVLPRHLEAVLDSSGDEVIDPVEHAAGAELGRKFMLLEKERDTASREVDELTRELRRQAQSTKKLRDERKKAVAQRNKARADLKNVGVTNVLRRRAGRVRRGVGRRLKRG